MTPPLPMSPVVVAEEDVAAVLECYRSGWLTMGPRTQRFEAQFAELVGTEHAVAVSAVVAALHLTLLAAGVGPGDEVLLSGLDAGATIAAVRACGATPVPCDVVGPADHTVDPEDVASRITPATKVVVAAHRWGYACDLESLRALCDEHGLTLIEDCAEAMMAEVRDGSGQRVGSVGAAGCFSLSATQQLDVGEGGVITTDDASLAARVRALRSHAMTSVTWDRHRGHAESYDVLDVGYNYRLDEPRAALALSRLPRLATDLVGRRAAVRAYRAALADAPGVAVPWPEEAAVDRSTHFAFGVLLEDAADRDRARFRLAEAGVESAIAACADAVRAPLPRCVDVAARTVVLPLAAGFGAAEVAQVDGAIRATLE